MNNIRNVIKQYVHDFIGNGIYDLIKFFSGLLITAIVGTGIVYKFLDLLLLKTNLVIIISVCMLFVFTITFIIIYRHFRKYKYHITEMDINFEYMGDKVVVISNITVKVLREGLDRVYNGVTWFPDEKTRISCLEQNFSIERLPKRDTFIEYYVKFNRKLKKGEHITFTTRVVNENKHNHFKNFYNRKIITPIDKLNITVVIPRKYGYKYITKEATKGSSFNDFVEKEKFEFLNTYTWEINKPKLGFEYKLLWEKK